MGRRGIPKHMKRLNAPKHWMLGKLDGVWAPHPSPGPHKLRECLPLVVLLRNRLKYALTRKETSFICQQRLVKVDGKVRTDLNYPAGFMDIVHIDKTNDMFRLLYDTKGRFTTTPVDKEEAKFKLLKVKKRALGPKGIPFIVTHDGRTIRYPDPAIAVNDTIKFDFTTQKILDHVKFEHGNKCTITGGANLGRIGIVENREKHPGAFDIVHVRDARGQRFATRASNVFIIGKGNSSLIKLPTNAGIKLSVIEERDRNLTNRK
jgi:small subunit ribosomal protein S4e